MMTNRNLFEQLPTLAQDPARFDILYSAKRFQTRLIESIHQAGKRICLVALNLEDDEAGREILTELYQVKQRNLGLGISAPNVV